MPAGQLVGQEGYGGSAAQSQLNLLSMQGFNAGAQAAANPESTQQQSLIPTGQPELGQSAVQMQPRQDAATSQTFYNQQQSLSLVGGHAHTQGAAGLQSQYNQILALQQKTGMAG